MVGRHLEIDDRKKGKTDGDVILELKGLSRNKEYEDCSFMLKAGEVVGVTGLVGAGRSELFQSVFGISRPDCGEILLHGKPQPFFPLRMQLSKVLCIFRKIGYCKVLSPNKA